MQLKFFPLCNAHQFRSIRLETDINIFCVHFYCFLLHVGIAARHRQQKKIFSTLWVLLNFIFFAASSSHKVFTRKTPFRLWKHKKIFDTCQLPILRVCIQEIITKWKNEAFKSLCLVILGSKVFWAARMMNIIWEEADRLLLITIILNTIL